MDVLVLLMVVLSFWRPTLPPTGREAVARAVIVFPFVYFTITGILSDWAIWLWYMYAVVPASAVAAIPPT